MLNVAAAFELNGHQAIAYASEMVRSGIFPHLRPGEKDHWGFVTVSFRNYLTEKIGKPRPSRKEPSHEGGMQFRDQTEARLKTAAAAKKLN